jgi:4-hydroxy-4-methyl-2-oxoglutarate aldolase
MKPPLSPELITALQAIDACTLANVIEMFRVRLRNEGFADGSIHAVFPQLPPVVGNAVTVQVRGASPPVRGRSYLDRTDWLEYVQSVPKPRIVVVQDISSKPGQGAFLGEVHLHILRALGCTGAITNGSVRDLNAIEALRFPLFAGSISVSHAYVHIVNIGGPVEMGGLAIESGDLLHADRHGVQTPPPEIIAQIPARAERLKAREKALIALCQAPDFSVSKLRAALADEGV